MKFSALKRVLISYQQNFFSLLVVFAVKVCTLQYTS
jgi:hypothetical protein